MSDEKKQLKTLLGTRKTIDNIINDLHGDIEFKISNLMIEHKMESPYDAPASVDKDNNIFIFLKEANLEFLKTINDEFQPVKMKIAGGTMTTPFGKVIGTFVLVTLKLFEEGD